MKELLLCSSLLAALATGGLVAGVPEKAMHFARDGSGQVLIFPYYSINSNETALTAKQTLISIVNTTDRAKAARLFFHEGRNGRVVGELTLYLAPFDTWVGALFSVAHDGAANLVTFDRSCTVPALRESTTLPRLANGVPYMTFSNASYTGRNNDSGPDDLKRTGEGYMTLIELGEVLPGGNGTLAAMTHAPDGVPPACLQLVNAWAPNGYWTQDHLANFAPPGGGIAGSAYPIDVLNGTMLLVEADVIENFSARVLNSPPGQGVPDLSDVNAGDSNQRIAVDLILDGTPTRLYYPLAPRPIDAVSALFMAESVRNQFVTSASLGGASEWVLNFPTKHYYVGESAIGLQPLPPFISLFPIAGDRGTAPVPFSVEAWTRDGVAADCTVYLCEDAVVGVRPPAPPVQLNFVTNVISFNQSDLEHPQSLILGAERSFPLDIYHPDYDVGGMAHEGAMVLRFANAQAGTGPTLAHDMNGRRLYGMPVQGFWVASYTNIAVTPGVLANYSDSIKHTVKQAATPAPSASTGSLAGAKE